ncbi:MAG: pentapeptide repeat-containing protein [Dolichospermum sp. DET50]|nr:pentapeptide repeat-containing protein [Dolichospermum sp. DET66]MBS3033726.1 pentapeptide repeat-containing protein [Dolichospermum sp. DET67]MBS3038929.1 pentapeptide repeat-containing protein [Dolichospermum sp. DET50]QSX66185.1 MAG: pentapeptide repeat-containing protein [Dolichospermum sp. DET69]
MTIESNSSNSSDSEINQEDELEIDDSDHSLLTEGLGKKQLSGQSSLKTNIITGTAFLLQRNSSLQAAINPRILLFTSLAIAITVISIIINNSFLGILGTLATLVLSMLILFPWLKDVIQEWFSPQDRNVFVGLIGVLVAIIGLFRFTNLGNGLLRWGKRVNWDASGTLAEWFGALGQIAIAIIAVYVAWRQYVISKDLTIQQNLLTVQQNIITQQQTIDSYFQGVSDLVLDEEGLLEDWPQERAIAEGRTAAIFSSVDGSGKAKILRFLSRSKLLSPLQRDRRLGRAILDGSGGYAEDRLEGVRVIDLGVMLAGADLADNDLRWTDLSEANLIRANLSNCDLVKANLSRTILYDANLTNTDLNGIRLFYGLLEQASPRSRTEPPNYETGEHTGAVVENANFTNAQRMSESSRYYCCAWCGEKTRQTIPGGCQGIPNKLGR